MIERFTHGTHPCGLCFSKGRTTATSEGRWHLTHWPAYWGSSNPDTLVLGFSMGARQVAAARNKPFREVAFATHRHKLLRILNALGIRRQNQSLDESMTQRSRGMGYTSLARCSLGYRGPGENDYKTSGTIMKVAPSDSWAGQVLYRCASVHLTALPTSVRRVVLLGTTDSYVNGVRAMLRRIFPDFADINPMAFFAEGRIWVFAVHPQQDDRVAQWIQDSIHGIAGKKRVWAQTAIARSYAQETARPTRIGTKRLVKRSELRA